MLQTRIVDLFAAAFPARIVYVSNNHVILSAGMECFVYELTHGLLYPYNTPHSDFCRKLTGEFNKAVNFRLSIVLKVVKQASLI